MSKYDVVIRVNNSGSIWDLDVSEVPVFQADFSTIESGDIGQLFGINSTEIAIPGTKHNNQFFNNLFNLGTTPSIGLKQSVPCQILVNGGAVFTGRLYIKNIITDQYYNTIYNCEVFNPLIDFKIVAEDLLLSQMDWSNYSHSYTGPNIVASWTDGLFNGDVYYPLAEYGTNPNLSNAPFIWYGTETTLGGNVGYMNNQFTTPVQVTQFKPSIRLKAVVDKIFDTLGFTYTSSFLDSDYFKNLYYLSTNDDTKWSFASGSQTLAHRTGSAQSILHGNPPVKLQLQTANPNPGALYNTTTTRFVAPVAGTYSIQFVAPIISVVVPLPDPTDGFEAVAYLYVNGAAVASVSKQYIPPFILPGPQTYFTSLSKTWEVELAAGDYVEMYGDTQDFDTYFIPPGLAFNWGPVGVDGMRMNVTSLENPVGGTVNLAAIMPSGESALSFIKGIIQKFNLIITPQTDSLTNFIIEPYSQWIQAGQVKDWTNIVDRSIKWKIEHPLLYNRPKTILFTDKQDTDYQQSEYQISEGKLTYGTYRYIDDGDIAQDTLTIGEYFASTPFILNRVIECPALSLYENGIQNNESFPEPYVFEHRILHRFQYTIPDVQNVWFFKVDYTNAASPINIYPTLIPVGNKQPDQFGTNNWPITYTNNEPDQIDLHYGSYLSPNLPDKNNLSHAYLWNFPNWPLTIEETNTTLNAYNQYWDLYLGTLYNIDARKLTCNVIINPEMIKDLQLNDNIFIDGHYYRIDKLEAVDFVEQQSTTAELIKLIKR